MHALKLADTMLFLSTLSLRRATASIVYTSVKNIFLSTLSLRRATTVTARIIDPTYDFYPRSPCGERLLGALWVLSTQIFLSTLSLRRATRVIPEVFHDGMLFLSTLSLRRATEQAITAEQTARISIHALLAESDPVNPQLRFVNPISIHALLAESDNNRLTAQQRQKDFYPRSPCGERRKPKSQDTTGHNFYPRSPCGERLIW